MYNVGDIIQFFEFGTDKIPKPMVILKLIREQRYTIADFNSDAGENVMYVSRYEELFIDYKLSYKIGDMNIADLRFR